MENVIYYNELYDLYGDLSTDKQKQYFQDYYFDNLSYSEMAEKYEVSRNAVFKQLHNVIDKLEEYESKLEIYEKKKKVRNLLDKIKEPEIKKELENLF